MSASHQLAQPAEPVLADAFAAFTAAAGWLQFSYQQLQVEVARLREELEQRNAALTSSLAENEKIRLSLGLILESLPCAVIALDAKGEPSFANPEAKRLLGDGEALGQAVSALSECSGTGCGERELCLPIAGTQHWLMIRSAAVYGRTGSRGAPQAGETVLIIRDVTEQREMEREREEARRITALAEVSSVLAHEIRNPLGSMELLAGLLMDSAELGGEQKSWLEHLQAGLRSLSATVNNVLHVHATGSAIHVPLDLAQVVREAVSFINPLAARHEIRLFLEENLHSARILGNSGELQQVILNLALNAFRHTAAGGEIRIKAWLDTAQSGRLAVIEFEDSGCGIPLEHLERIFDAGFSTASQSPGLGLAVCRKIVQQHGGSISASSESGQGAAFRMEFPVL
ncbi:MAG TPA: ATP-binding protein [Terriglobales bacterium]|nr:ATP-binding protein [Terriglobales bacterium]